MSELVERVTEAIRAELQRQLTEVDLERPVDQLFEDGERRWSEVDGARRADRFDLYAVAVQAVVGMEETHPG